MKHYTPLKPLLYSYIRFSTIEQAKGQSLNRQLSFAKDVAKEKGLELDDSLSMRDMGLSAFHRTNITRGALGIFLAAVEQGKVPPGSILVLESLDRISRAAPLESQGIIAQIINADITVITAADRKEYNKENIKKNPMDLVYIILVLIRANEESETKSLRVRSALTKQCQDWLAGKRGFRVKCGMSPRWVVWNDETKLFELEPRNKVIMLRKIELFKKGYGGIKIAELINDEFGAGTVHHTGANVYKEVKRRSLIGELNVKVGDVDYVLEDYYPPLMSKAEFDFLVADSSKRGATKHTQKFVGVLSGVGVFKCGSCGKSVGSHVVYRKKCIDEVKSSHKRYGCVEARRSNNCTMSSTVQIEMVENAVVTFCQDKVNLQRILLKGSDRELINTEESVLIAQLEKINDDINSLTETLLILDGTPPQAIANKISALETQARDVKTQIDTSKNKLAKIDHSFRDEVTDRWLSLTKNLVTLSGDERLAIRQLVKDTFKSITLQIDVTQTEKQGGLLAVFNQLLGDATADYFDLMLEFHNDKKRLLRVNKLNGKLVSGVES
ncbi:recombinase family protein [uncultured Pseudoalteromonas sp.]|uniref:recombinase family protein n=1 Tax=uncultured Pseudoalteromonas sp. TaxID=114053 RepID=UPI0025955659|nr:recombinase family protein [uncultured Pseudoalteromonas sp.]